MIEEQKIKKKRSKDKKSVQIKINV